MATKVTKSNFIQKLATGTLGEHLIHFGKNLSISKNTILNNPT